MGIDFADFDNFFLTADEKIGKFRQMTKWIQIKTKPKDV